MSEKWSLAGTFVEACNCDVACPCIFGGSPTAGECKAFVGWHIDKGNYADVALDGLNVALAVYTPGDMDKTEWKVALYYDDKASEAQKKALMRIFTGQAGGWLAGLAEAWKPGSGELLGAKSVGIEYHAEGKRRSLKIADVVESEIEAIIGVDGTDVTLVNAHPAASALAVAKSKKLSYHDYVWQWEISEKSGFFGPFVYQSD